MSSSANTFSFSTFSTDPEAGLPFFNQIFNMTEFSSDPFFGDTFPSSVFGTTRLEFEYDSADNFGYCFLMRDSAGCLQAKGKVTHLDTTVQNVNGMEIIKIIKRDSNYSNENTFEIYHKNVAIGTVKVTEKAPPESCLKIIGRSTTPKIKPNITVRSLKIGDFAIFRDNSSSTPLVNIQLPYADVYNKRDFDGSIIFHPETGITADEQILCTAAAIAFKVTMKKMTKQEENEVNVMGWCGGIILTLIIIGLMILFFNYMESRSCERRKAAGYLSYVNREC